MRGEIAARCGEDAACGVRRCAAWTARRADECVPLGVSSRTPIDSR